MKGDLKIKTDIERNRISREATTTIVLFEGSLLSGDDLYVQRLELRLYRERFDQIRGFYSLITVYLKSNEGEAELRFDEGFRGDDPLGQISSILVSHVGLESVINRILIELKTI
jgi:hypothetical protein